tara:strand:- start:4017 stop:4463 length:447 start_codon:yes stop_codon:yes gene_type:complete
MKQGIQIDKNFDLKKIKLDLSKELNFSGDIIVKDHFKRLNVGTDANGRGMKQLKPATVARKGSDQVLVDKDKMRHLVRSRATKAKPFVNIHPGKKQKRDGVTNAQIGLYHQTGAGRLPKREWFGITKKAEKQCLKAVELRIEKLIRNA